MLRFQSQDGTQAVSTTKTVAKLEQAHSDTFDLQSSVPAPTQYKISTGDIEPIRQRALRLPIHFIRKPDDAIRDMAGKNVIFVEVSHSFRWSSTLCRLSGVSRKDPFLLPHIDATFVDLCGAKNPNIGRFVRLSFQTWNRAIHKQDHQRNYRWKENWKGTSCDRQL